MKKVCGLIMMLAATPAFANPYVFGRIGASDYVVKTSQYHVLHEGLPRSTIVDGKINDVNAAYHVGLGYDFDWLRFDVEASYGRYVMSGNWSLIDKSIIPAYVQNFAQPSTYTLKDSIYTFMLNAHVDVVRFGCGGMRLMCADLCGNGDAQVYNALFLTGGVGMARISSTGKVVVDFETLYGDDGFIYTQDAKDTTNHFAFNLGGGVSLGLTKTLNLDLEYRYNNYGKFSEDMTTRKYSAHELSAGLRYTF